MHEKNEYTFEPIPESPPFIIDNTTNQLVEKNRILEERNFQLEMELKKKDELASKVPNEFICPIAQMGDIMQDPVVAKDGNTYERKQILRWFNSKKTSPITNKSIPTDLVPNLALKKLISDFLDKYPQGNPEELLETCKKGDIERVNYLLFVKVDLNYQDPFTGKTALHIAIENKQQEVVKLLLKQRVKLDIQDRDGQTILHSAAIGDNTILTMLCTEVKYQAIPTLLEKCDLNGKTAMQYAVDTGEYQNASSLKQIGAKRHNEFDNSQKVKQVKQNDPHRFFILPRDQGMEFSEDALDEIFTYDKNYETNTI